MWKFLPYILFLYTKKDHLHYNHGSHSSLQISPVAQRRQINTNSNTNLEAKTYENENNNSGTMGGLSPGRPKSSCGLSRLPGIKYENDPDDNTLKFVTHIFVFVIFQLFSLIFSVVINQLKQTYNTFFYYKL